MGKKSRARAWCNGAEAVGRAASADSLWKQACEERSDGQDCWVSTALSSFLLGSYGIELAVKSWSKVAHEAGGRSGRHPMRHDLGLLWENFPAGKHQEMLQRSWENYRREMKPAERVGGIDEVMKALGPVFELTRYIGDPRDEKAEQQQRELLGKIVENPDHYYRCLQICAKVFNNAFVIYDIAEMRTQGEDGDAEKVKRTLVESGWAEENLEQDIAIITSLIPDGSKG